MKKYITFFFAALSNFASNAQNIVVQQGNPSGQENTMTSPGTIYILLIAIGVTAFLFIIVYALGKANRGLAESLRDHLEK